MATYEEIHGKRVNVFDSDPTLNSSYEGQVWYNSSEGNLKSVVALEAWTSGTVYPRQADHTAGSGTQTAALSCSDNIPSPAAEITSTFEYNGSGWSAGGSMNTERGDGQNNMTGSQTASFYVGGRPNAGPPTPFGSPATEEYNGSSWTAGGAYPAGMRGTNAFGTLTAGVNAGGNSANPSVSTNVNNEYNGTAWTSGNNNTLGRYNCSSSGTSTAGILVAGFSNPPPVVNSVTEEYDGSSWTSGGSLPEARNGLGGSGTQTANIVFGGASPPGTKTTTTSKYDGTSWTTSPASLGTAREKFGSAKGASQTATLAWCGNTPTDATEEYNFGINTFTAAAWASGGTMSQKRYGGASGGTPTTAWYATGYINPGYSNATEEYNGSSWTAGGNITGTNTQSTGSCGTLTAGSRFSGLPPVGPSGTPRVQHEQYDGTSWTNNPATLQQATSGTSGSGTQDACLYTRGRPSTYNEEYNGTAWSAANTISTTGRSGTNSGTQTAGLFLGGEQPPGPYLKLVDEYDGTNWTAGGSLVIPQGGSCNSGTQTDTMAASGYTTDSPWGPSTIEECQIYDGTAFATTASVSSDRSSGGSSNRGNGPSGSNGALIFAGSPAPNSVATEEFTAVTETVTAKTLTTS